MITGVRTTALGTWILTYDGAFLLEEKSWVFPKMAVSDVVEARDGSHWFATLTDGVKVIPNLALRRYAKDPDGLPTERFNRIRHLPDGNIVASDNNGMLVLLHPERGMLASFRADIDRESEVLEVDSVHGRILVAFGDLYLLDMGTLKLLDRKKGNFKSIVISNGMLYTVNGHLRQRMVYDGRSFGELESVSAVGTQPYSVMADGRGNIWWLTDEGVMQTPPPPPCQGGSPEFFPPWKKVRGRCSATLPAPLMAASSSAARPILLPFFRMKIHWNGLQSHSTLPKAGVSALIPSAVTAFSS
jgi:hypothetical protein